ncbi:Acyltransferase-like protein [Acorus calamus]|uniref:Acyltransferase-like protein n=1 Tax=Acorus calamus TaxID=4465 RepID=A0AAV9CVQ4_ACOCL|nr:Acyltransferase-like protein [Acorus calamus]
MVGRQGGSARRSAGAPVKGSPLLLFLPGIDGVGMGLILHHRSLGNVGSSKSGVCTFPLMIGHLLKLCLFPFPTGYSGITFHEGLVKLVEHTLRVEHAMNPNKPIYIVGDSFGGCLALAVAAPTSFGKSQLQPLLPLLESLPDELHITVPYLLSFIMGDPVKMAMATVENDLPPPQILDKLSTALTSLLPRLSDLSDIIPKDTLLWKLKLLKSAASYTNSRLHAVKAEVLLLASGKDNMLPSGDEAKRLWTSLQNCRVRYFKDSGHTLLLEGGINLLTVIKGTHMYRRSKHYDHLRDYLPPTITEFNNFFGQRNRWFNIATSPVIFSTLKDGRLVRGLAGIPDEGPVLFIGYHMLMGLELGPLYEAFLKEKRICVRGLAHPLLFSKKDETSQQELSQLDFMRVFGSLPVSPINMYKLFSKKSFVLLYPGGAREALHRKDPLIVSCWILEGLSKGEEYRLFWPSQPEFVRMAARFGVTIIPFGTVGEDDLAQLVLDYNDQMTIPFTRDWIRDINQDVVRIRTDEKQQLSDQDVYLPGLLPKIPGRFYYLFGKPIETRGMEKVVEDKSKANSLYLEIKSEVEKIMSYLKEKREVDPYRGIIERTVYQASGGSADQIPSFEI